MKKKTLAVIGSGPAALMAVSLLKDTYDVFLFEKPSRTNTLGKRILVSGNGRANFLNEDLLSLEDARNMLSYLRNVLHFAYQTEGKLYYPYFNRSECLHSVLTRDLSSSVHVLFSEVKEIHPERKTVSYLQDGKRKEQRYDYAIFAPGGRSYDREDFTYGLLDSLNVAYRPFESLLCPVKVKEKIPPYLDKNRLKVVLSLLWNGNEVFQENGEVLFKSDGISGICVFDSTLTIRHMENRGGTFTYTMDYSKGLLLSRDLPSAPLFLKRYVEDRKLVFPQPLRVTYAGCYPFSSSQVSYGGILLSERNEDLSLKKHPEIYTIGEVMDKNFICGGYNMGNALMEGYRCGKELLKHAGK